MATIRAYTTIEQSRKLAEILPLESADMFLAMNGILPVMSKYIDNGLVTADETAIPCWSLASLLGAVSEEVSLNSFKDGNWNAMVQQNGKMIYSDADNPVDACYEMILKLNELNLL